MKTIGASIELFNRYLRSKVINSIWKSSFKKNKFLTLEIQVKIIFLGLFKSKLWNTYVDSN